MNRKITIGIQRLFLIITVMFLLQACDLLKPEEYDSKEFGAPEVDQGAVNKVIPTVTTRDSILFLSNSPFQTVYFSSTNSYAITSNASPIGIVDTDTMLVVNLGVIDTTLTLYKMGVSNRINSEVSLYFNPAFVRSKALASVVGRALRDTATDNQIIQLKFNELIDSLQPLAFDRLMFIQYPDSQRVTYTKISATQERDIYIYTPFDQPRLVNFDLVRSDTSLVSYNNVTAMETIYIQTKAGTYASLRYKYHLAPGSYIVRFSLTDDAPVVGSFEFFILPL